MQMANLIVTHSQEVCLNFTPGSAKYLKFEGDRALNIISSL